MKKNENPLEKISQAKKFLICAPSYSQNNGGAIVLHKLCHLINLLGREAYVFPLVENLELNKFNYKTTLIKFFKKHIREPFRKYKTNPDFISPIKKKIPKGDDWIVIYPEITFGNPLNMKNIVRWFLHNPGFHSGNIYFGPNEFHIRFASWFKEFAYPESTLSPSYLQIFHSPLHLYNLENANPIRAGSAYCVRKGSHKKISHELDNSILIDGLKHEVIAEIFKKVKTFISYDSNTAYSYYAALCGCDSIVIPDEGVTEDEWMPDPENRYGLAYGWNNIDKARKTRHLLESRFQKFESQSQENVILFLKEVDRFFQKTGDNK